MIFSITPGLADDTPVAQNSRIAGDATRTRFVIDFSRTLRAVAFPLADPWRIIIDLPEVSFQLPADTGHPGRGLVTSWRYGAIGPGRSRIVIDTAGPAAVDKIFVMEPVDQQPARLVVDLVPQSEADFRAALSRAALDNPAPTPVAPAPAAPQKRAIVVLDPGHGGVDAGATGVSGVLEKDIVLAIARLVRDDLVSDGKVDVLLTRENDVFVPLDDRVSFARTHKADLFLSIHADSLAAQAEDVRGATIYTLSDKASDRDAARLAEKENAADAVGGVQVPEKKEEIGGILLDLARRETRNFSAAFTAGMEQELSATAKMSKTPHRSAGFRVLRTQNIPAALLELGYLSQPVDEKLLSTPGYQQRIAAAIARSVEKFFVRNGMAAKPGVAAN